MMWTTLDVGTIQPNAHYSKKIRSRKKKIARGLFWSAHWSRKRELKEQFRKAGYDGSGYL